MVCFLGAIILKRKKPYTQLYTTLHNLTQPDTTQPYTTQPYTLFFFFLAGKIQQLEQIVANDPKSILSTTSKGLSPFHLCFSRQEREEGGVSPLALLSVLFSSPAKEEVGKVLEKADPWQVCSLIIMATILSFLLFSFFFSSLLLSIGKHSSPFFDHLVQ